jgi:chemotaxis protein CheZ
MVAKRKIDETGDSDDLQSLFDNIAAGKDDAPASAPAVAQPVAPAPAPTRAAPAHDGDDNDELQALFDSEAGKYAPDAPRPNGVAEAQEDESESGDRETEVYNRIGKMTRKLNDMLIELGLDSKLQEVANTMPDTRQRLNYVAQMTEQAASKVLNAVDIAKPVAARVEADAGALCARWDKVFSNQLSTGEFKKLADETRAFLGSATEGGQTLNAQLIEIVMAQDFQDLTGQVIKKAIEIVQSLESQLLCILIDAAPQEIRTEKADSLLNGPVIDGQGRDDVVTSQEQVDDLLASLGF